MAPHPPKAQVGNAHYCKIGLHFLHSDTTDLLDLSVSPMKEPGSGCFHGNSWHNPMIGSSGRRLKDAIMSVEEMKIRGELEMDIERDLEEEIKDDIYHLALRLHRLYQHQKERSAREIRGKMLTEVNVIIRMEGGTKIEIKETRKEIPGSSRTRASATRVTGGIQVPNTTNLDWAKSLRQAGAGTKKKISRNGSHPNLKLVNARRNSGLLQLGWRI